MNLHPTVITLSQSIFKHWPLLLFLLLTATWSFGHAQNTTESLTPMTSSSSGSIVTWPKQVKLAVILPHKAWLPYTYEKVFPSIQIAVDTIERDPEILPGVKLVLSSKNSYCSDVYGAKAAIDMYMEKKADVFIGPICDMYVLAPVVRFCKRWNLPVVTAGGLSNGFDNNEFSAMTRVMASYRKLGKAMVSILDYFSFESVMAMLQTSEDKTLAVNNCLYIVRSIFLEFKRVKRSTRYKLMKDEDKPEGQYAKYLKELSHKTRIIVLCASPDSVREIMIKAHELNFDNGEYVFFNIDLFSSHEATSQPWIRKGDSEERNNMARKAYEALMTVTLRKPTSREYRNFSEKVKAKAAQISKNITYGGKEVNSFVGAFHDAVILYAYALNETITAGGNVTDGLAITKRMWNRTIKGITGTVSIDENGDRNADYSLLDLNPKTNQFEVVADYYGDTKQFKPVKGKKIYWAGGRDEPPPDKPQCGFDGSLCPPDKPFPEYGIVIIVLGSVLLIVLVVVLLVYRHFKLESQLSEMNWRVRWTDIMFGEPTKNKKLERQNEQTGSYHSECSADTIAVHLNEVGNRQLFTKTGYYKGAILAIKPIQRAHISIQKPLLLEIKKMKDLQNDHLVRFHGVCIDVPNQCILTEYCPKGSLQDVLENDQIKLDWMFRYSIMQDIVRGMAYLHSTDIKSHGHLKSSNCVVDSRFVVKITDFGLHYFREKEEELEENYYAKERSFLWTAPELLRMSNHPPWGTQKGDVYSFAIICQEIVYRNSAFYLQNLELSPRETTDRLIAGAKPYFRPTLEEFDCPNDELAGVIRRCWAEEPAERPDFQSLRTMIKKLNKEGDKGDILDNLLSRMEQYANNLEALVEERTSDYLQEKKKAEELLYNMLPRAVASQLIRGETVSAEWYDSVTIYFSDICGFTALSAASTPMQVVALLNDLYTCFDSIVEHFDVYKVETIGDAYMVVSGLPVRNGTLHAREIARMSLSLLDNVFRFKIKHRPQDQLKLRIGIHSGPVCAGVVGLKMPRYCLFGDTVNTASRMESNGSPLRIHVSPFTGEILQTFGLFQLEKRGAVEMKGKGAITTFWLLGEEGSPYNIRQQGHNEPNPDAPL